MIIIAELVFAEQRLSRSGYDFLPDRCYCRFPAMKKSNGQSRGTVALCWLPEPPVFTENPVSSEEEHG